MPFFSKMFSKKKISSTNQANNPPPQPVTWSAHAPQSGSSPSPYPRFGHTLTATANAAGELLLFGGYLHKYNCPTNDLFVFSRRDFSTTLLQTSGEVPTPRYGHCAALIGTTLLICGGRAIYDDQNRLNHDSLYLLNLGTSDPCMSSSTPADHSFALQKRESGPALWSMVPARAIVLTIPQT
jgi:hypothetical protein